jgi:hypothetical protein
MEVLKVISQIKTNNQTLAVMGADGVSSHLHINDTSTNKNSTITPLSAIKEIMETVIEGVNTKETYIELLKLAHESLDSKDERIAELEKNISIAAKIMIDITNAQTVTDDGDSVGYLVTNKMIKELDVFISKH